MVNVIVFNYCAIDLQSHGKIECNQLTLQLLQLKNVNYNYVCT